METLKNIVPQNIKVKRTGRIENLVLEIPPSLEREFIKKGSVALVSVSETSEKFCIIYEFTKKAE